MIYFSNINLYIKTKLFLDDEKISGCSNENAILFLNFPEVIPCFLKSRELSISFYGMNKRSLSV